MRKIMALLLALGMVFGLLTTAFAVPAATTSAAETEKRPATNPHRYGNVLYETGFEDPPATEGWTFQDQDGDSVGFKWILGNTNYRPYYGDGVLISESWNASSGAMTPDNVAISPAITIPSSGRYYVSLRASCTLAGYPENFAMYIGTSTDVFTMTKLHYEDFSAEENYREFGADLSLYTGKTVYIAIRHYDSVDNSVLVIDEFRVAESDYYPVEVDGIAVSDCNKFDILENGVFRFDYDLCTLFVDGDYTAVGGADMIHNQLDGLTVNVLSDSTLRSLSCGIFAQNAYTNVTGEGTLTICSDASAGVYVLGTTFGLHNASVEIESALSGISADLGSAEERVMIDHSALKVKGDPAGIGPGFADIELTGCEIVKPENATIKSGAVYTAVGTMASEVEIQPYDVYDLIIDGTQVTARNCEDVLGDGVFRFDPEKDTLYLNGTHSTVDTAIASLIDGLLIRVESDTILTGGSVGIELQGNTKITGPGKLTVSAEYIGVYVSGTSMLRIEDARLSATGVNGYGITGSTDEILYIESSDVKASGTTAAINDFQDIIINYCEMIKPVSGINAGTEIQDGLGNTALEVELKAIVTYPITIAGNRITENNHEDVLGNGSFAYDPEVNTLYVIGSCTDSMTIIDSSCEGLTISIGSNVTLESTAMNAIELNADTTITGLGYLTVKADGCAVLVGDGAKLTLDNCWIDALGTAYGICGMPKGESLCVKNSTVHATGASGAICDFDGGIQLVAMDILEPENAILAEAEIQNADSSRATEVSLQSRPVEVYDIWVKGVQISEYNQDDVLGDGVFAFDPASSTLLVKGKAEATTTPVIETGFGSLTIYVAEDSELVSASEPTLWLANFTKITGPGRLKLRSNNQCIHVSAPVAIFIETAQIEATANYAGAICGDQSGQTLFITDSDVRATADITAIGGFNGGITLQNCYVKTPEKGEIREGKIVYPNGTAADEVEIRAGIYNPFVDVAEGAYYFDAVLWAVDHDPQITNGVDATHFKPNNTCTRAQIVTFLWRAKGCPEPSSKTSPFTDVQDKGKYYFKAVLWAVESGVTTGLNATTFGPDAGCTRAQVVTFLWRADGKPSPISTDNPFVDVTGGYYYNAVLWAVERGITKGMDATHFKPNNTCTRGQIVTFLYRDWM